eukprot:TRINITY_DN6320_c0_g1_i1.p1 TRINITY_DN6320_c0_g1~~TRINITY_DN6320_c0_g1_i1.p1  ORF type:complete len:349 (+),score=91.03 TRINITY_DN6320_c0_g1_i1:2-1048(+)
MNAPTAQRVVSPQRNTVLFNDIDVLETLSLDWVQQENLKEEVFRLEESSKKITAELDAAKLQLMTKWNQSVLDKIEKLELAEKKLVEELIPKKRLLSAVMGSDFNLQSRDHNPIDSNMSYIRRNPSSFTLSTISNPTNPTPPTHPPMTISNPTIPSTVSPTGMSPPNLSATNPASNAGSRTVLTSSSVDSRNISFNRNDSISPTQPLTNVLYPDSQKETIIQLTRDLLSAISVGDIPKYTELADENAGSFEPEACGAFVVGTGFYRHYLVANSAIAPDLRPTSTMSSINVRFCAEGNVAIITYIRLITTPQPPSYPTNKPYQETRIWERKKGRWLNVHVHRSSNCTKA